MHETVPAPAPGPRPRSRVLTIPPGARTLPSRCYTTPEASAADRARVFHDTWQCLGSAESLASPGAYLTAEVDGEPILVVRGADRVLRGFYNVCPHRAGMPAQGCGRRRVFRCNYHGWAYGAEGRLVGAPELDDVERYHLHGTRLTPVRVATYGPLLFVHLGADGPR